MCCTAAHENQESEQQKPVTLELQRIDYNLGGRAIEDTIEKRLNCKSRAQKAAIASHEPFVLESDTLDNSTGLNFNRCFAIQHFFLGVYGLEKPDQWNECGVVTGIIKRLGISCDSRDS